MENSTRFTLMTFPQFYDGDKKLLINILFLPRNQNPLSNPVDEVAGLPSFTDANLSFSAKIIAGTELYPNNLNAIDKGTLPIKTPQNKKALFTALADSKHFNITNLDALNLDLAINDFKPAANNNNVKKYLPVSYRNAFNFIEPVMPENGVTDDSYRCAVKAAKYVPGFQQTTNKISWGKVFAYILRNRLLGKEAGFIYHTELEIDPSDFKDGGWVYIDLADNSDYKEHFKTDQNFIKRYAARIPAMVPGKSRPLFAASLFPVVLKSGAVDPPAGVGFDNIFTEAADYDDGFSKIVHAFQPVSQNLLAEESDGFHPTHESGIRLGWDDEQLLSWYVRLMSNNPDTGTRTDAPVGVFGYHIDVRKNKSGNAWESLNAVQTNDGIDLLKDLLPNNQNDGTFIGELPYQVYPATLDGDDKKSFWLPMYFANWNSHSMVLPDAEAIRIYQHNEGIKPDTPDPLNPELKGKTNVTGSPANNLLKIYRPTGLLTKLQYGISYDFRVRMTDITHGGPLPSQEPFNDAVAPNGFCHFKRFIAPSTVRMQGMPANVDGEVFELPILEVQRPVLSYPAITFCSGYANAADKLYTRLKKQLDDANNDPAKKIIQFDTIGLADPDVESVEITVEVQALKMDYQLSVSGKESYAKLYTVTRLFNIANSEDDLDNKLQIPINFQEVQVLNFGDSSNLGDLVFDTTTTTGAIELPKARKIRITIRAICKIKPGYYGLENPDPAFNTRYGRTTFISLYKASEIEKDLYLTKKIEAIYLQPDDIALEKNIDPTLQQVLAQPVLIPNCVQRLSQQLKISNNNLSLVGNAGQRVQFGCSARIRHTLAPDNSALTFASKAELYHHWLCCIKLDIKRDWTWDALADTSFIITRKMNFRQTPAVVKEEIVGDVDFKHAISFNALQNADRNYTTLIFIDAVEPKKEPGLDAGLFPDILEINYCITPKFKEGHGAANDGVHQFETLQLPVTINPVQIPKITSAGIALSPYLRTEKYSGTEPRQRFLWVEFEKAIADPNDLYFARVIGYGPDQLISNNNAELENVVAEPPLNIDPEYLRVITPGSTDDHAGINAMQPMEKSLTGDKHYLLPLPSGLNESSADLFGFFTYELRVGHSQIWSTAQGRFGRPLKATGIQHPAPTLTCAVNRDEDKIYVSAPYATAVLNGINVTANPPRTELWCMLYAQVKQADNGDAKNLLKDFRNILLDDRFMHWGFKLNESVEDDTLPGALNKLPNQAIFKTTNLMQPITKKFITDALGLEEINSKYIKLITDEDLQNKNADAVKYGKTFWTNKEVEALLKLYGLPVNLPLSVLCVEVFTNITNDQQFRTRPVSSTDFNQSGAADGTYQRESYNKMANSTGDRKPLSNGLGNFRILRTSPLCAVPYVCCT